MTAKESKLTKAAMRVKAAEGALRAAREAIAAVEEEGIELVRERRRARTTPDRIAEQELVAAAAEEVGLADAWRRFDEAEAALAAAKAERKRAGSAELAAASARHTGDYQDAIAAALDALAVFEAALDRAGEIGRRFRSEASPVAQAAGRDPRSVLAPRPPHETALTGIRRWARETRKALGGDA